MPGADKAVNDEMEYPSSCTEEEGPGIKRRKLKTASILKFILMSPTESPGSTVNGVNIALSEIRARVPGHVEGLKPVCMRLRIKSGAHNDAVKKRVTLVVREGSQRNVSIRGSDCSM